MGTNEILGCGNRIAVFAVPPKGVPARHLSGGELLYEYTTRRVVDQLPIRPKLAWFADFTVEFRIPPLFGGTSLRTQRESNPQPSDPKSDALSN